MSIIHEALKKAGREEAEKPAVEEARRFRFSAAPVFPSRSLLVPILLLLCLIGVGSLAYLKRSVLTGLFSSAKGRMNMARSLPATVPAAPSVTVAPVLPPSGPPPTDSGEAQDQAALHEKSGMSYYRLEKWEDAEREWVSALSFRPKSAEIQSNLGLVLKKMGRDQEAESRFQAALQLDPAHVQAMNNLGLLYEQQNRLEDAKRLYEKAVMTRPGFPEAHLNYAVLLERAGYFEEAKRHYQSFLSSAGRQQDETVALVKKHLDHLP